MDQTEILKNDDNVVKFFRLLKAQIRSLDVSPTKTDTQAILRYIWDALLENIILQRDFDISFKKIPSDALLSYLVSQETLVDGKIALERVVLSGFDADTREPVVKFTTQIIYECKVLNIVQAILQIRKLMILLQDLGVISPKVAAIKLNLDTSTPEVARLYGEVHKANFHLFSEFKWVSGYEGITGYWVLSNDELRSES